MKKGKKKYDLSDPDQAIMYRAEQRAKFKQNIRYFVFVNTFLIVIWFSTTSNPWEFNNFWPAWVILFYGISLFFAFRKAYGPSLEEEISAEYNNLKDEH
ncbi:MAG: hypothetical protein ACI959_001960 [Limisphaerales bacterium]|jgi:hypothetical protein